MSTKQTSMLTFFGNGPGPTVSEKSDVEIEGSTSTITKKLLSIANISDQRVPGFILCEDTPKIKFFNTLS